MTINRLVITAVVTENRPVREVAAQYGVSKSWIYLLLDRYRHEGEAAFESRPRRPKTVPTAIPPETVDLIVELREKLTATGLDAGPDTIGWHLTHHHGVTVSRATIARYLTKAGLVVAEPKKKPKSSYIRFQAAMSNQTWQSDFTHYRLRRLDGRPSVDCEILTWLDDCSRFALSVTAHHRVTGTIVLATFRQTVAEHGIPASTLTDNGMVFTTRLSGGKRGAGTRNAFGDRAAPARGPVEELRPRSSHDLREGRALPADPQEVAPRTARAAEHDRRPPGPARRLRRGVQRPPAAPVPAPPGHPATVYTSRPKATPTTGDRDDDTHDRVRHDKVDKAGKITWRYRGEMYSIGVGRTHTGTRVIVLSQDLEIQIINAATGELLRELVLDTSMRYQGTGRPPGPTR